MKSLNDFITESNKEFEYRVKIAGELDTANYEKFKTSLGKYSLVSCSAPKKTPIQSNPVGFPGLENQEIHIFDIAVSYPASIDEIRDLARLASFDLNKIVVIDKAFDDSMNRDAEIHALEDGDVRLEKTDYPANTKEQTEAKDAYADSYKEAAKQFASEADTDFEIAGEKTAPAKFNTDDAEGKDSPMTVVKTNTLFKDILK